MPELKLTNSDDPAILSSVDIEAAQAYTWYEHGSRGVIRGHDKLPLLQFIGQRMGLVRPLRVAKGRDYTRPNFKEIALRPVLATDPQDAHTFIVSPEDLEHFRQFQWRRNNRIPVVQGSGVSIFAHLAERMGLVKAVQFVNNDDFRHENIKGNLIVPEIVDGKCRLPVALGVFTTIDARDYVWAKDGICGLSNKGYATWGKTFLHREVLERNGVAVPEHTDHIDRDKLHNTFENLRPATPRQNRANTVKQSKFGAGVEFKDNRFAARIRVDDKQRHLGSYDTPQLAANARDIAAVFVDYQYLPRNSEGPWGLPNAEYDKLVAKLNSYGLNVPTEVMDESEVEVFE